MKFNSTKKEIIEEIKKVIPPQEWCNDPIWNGKYGHYWFGIGDGFDWNIDVLEETDEKVLLEILVMCHSEWHKKYAEWHDSDSKKLQKLYNVVRDCRKYIVLEDTSYESNFIMLDKMLEFVKRIDKNKEA